MEISPQKSETLCYTKNGTLNDQPLFINGGRRRFLTDETEEISNFRRALPQFLAVSVKNILLFAYGMTLGFPTLVIPAIQGGEGREHSDIVLNKEEISWFSSINLICVPLGCLFSGLLTQPIGKRRAMQVVNLPILASWLLFHFASSTEHLYLALSLSGIGGGLMEAPVLTYVAEITEPKYRGILSALGSTCIVTGVFVQFIMGSLMDWRTIAAVSSAFPVISIIALCFVPESPTWLIRERRFHEAVKALQWLRGWVPENKIEAEFNRLYEELITQPAIEDAAENCGQPESKCAHWLRMFRKRSFVVPFLLVSFTFFIGHFSGKTPLQTYAVQIFHTLKAPINKYHATILLGMVELIATILCVFLIHFTGKRPLVFISTIGVGICFFATATYVHYLKVIPGFAVNNIVVNASFSTVPKESIISQHNITNIFETEHKALLIALQQEDNNNLNEKMNFETTTLYTAQDEGNDMNIEMTTLLTVPITDDINTEPNIRLIRETQNETSLDDDFYENITLMDIAALDYVEDENDTSSTPLDLIDSEEDNSDMTTTIMPVQMEDELSPEPEREPETLKKLSQELPSTKQVNEEILLPVPKQEKNYLVWLPLILILGSAFFAHCGIRMIPWILIGEVFPAQVRSTASGLVGAVGYIFGFLANKLFIQMLTTLTLSGTFWLYSFVAFFGAISLYFILPETENRTLGEIEAHFSKKSKVNLLKKSLEKNIEHLQFEKSTNNNQIPLDNLQNLQIPIGSPQTETKIIQLQQSDFLQKRNETDGGATNLGFEENNTTHL